MKKKMSILESPNQKSSTSLQEISFPSDVLIEILKRLPLKSLARSTSVCKSWFSLLTSPIFLSILATYRLRKSSDTQKLLLYREPIKIHVETYRSLYSVHNNGTLLKQFWCPAGSNHFVVCSADGLLCLYKFYSRKPEFEPLILWNPSIKKALTVPVPLPIDYALECTVGGFPKLIFGVGFDLSSSVYKVVRVSYFNGRGSDSKSTNFRAHVYSMSDQKWRNLGVTSVPQCITTIRWRGVYLNGVIHWICNVCVNSDEANDLIQPSILILKLGTEEFGEIKLPKKVLGVPYQKLRVVVVPRHGKEVLGVIHIVMNVFSLWVMEENGVWKELFTTNFGGMINKDVNVVVLSDHFVMVQMASGGWVSYDHNSQQIQQVRQGELDYVDVYVESLILLGQNKGVLPVRVADKTLFQVGVEAARLTGPKKRLR